MTEFIVNITRPELTPEEHARRMKQIKKAATELLKDKEKKQREANRAKLLQSRS